MEPLMNHKLDDRDEILSPYRPVHYAFIHEIVIILGFTGLSCEIKS
jgi:hypothetical protein